MLGRQARLALPAVHLLAGAPPVLHRRAKVATAAKRAPLPVVEERACPPAPAESLAKVALQAWQALRALQADSAAFEAAASSRASESRDARPLARTACCGFRGQA